MAFLYRGPARTVTFTGDFDRWQPRPPRSRRLGGSDLWLQEETFPADARLDYKIVVDGQRWLLDPANPHRQRGGFGDNSVLAMPGYRPSPFLERDPDTPRGHLESGRLPSAALQSPAFHAGDSAILDLYRTGAPADVDFFISWGTFHDFGPTTRDFLDILDGAGIDYRTMTTHEGHSWGQWRALLDDVLLAFWPVR